jgi:hypothetical protein
LGSIPATGNCCNAGSLGNLRKNNCRHDAFSRFFALGWTYIFTQIGNRRKRFANCLAYDLCGFPYGFADRFRDC